MAERSPIFKGDGNQIGYIEGNEAYDLLGKPCCNYNAKTGNLSDLNSGKLVGYVSSEGKVAGVSWIIDELFPKSDEPAVLINSTEVQNRPISEELEGLFKLLRNRIGLNGTGSPDD